MSYQMRIERVLALPGTLTGSTMYIVKPSDAGLAEVYFTNQDGSEARHVIKKSEIQAMITSSISDFNNILVTADITTRDALTLDRNALVLVLDAAADLTVTAGAALYVYQTSDTSYTKVSEFESLDVVLEWDSIQNKPTSTVANIDDAVNRKHSHANSADLDLIGKDANGHLTFNGANVDAHITVSAW
jgi:hypothetical protein